MLTNYFLVMQLANYLRNIQNCCWLSSRFLGSFAKFPSHPRFPVTKKCDSVIRMMNGLPATELAGRIPASCTPPTADSG